MIQPQSDPIRSALQVWAGWPTGTVMREINREWIESQLAALLISGQNEQQTDGRDGNVSGVEVIKTVVWLQSWVMRGLKYYLTGTRQSWFAWIGPQQTNYRFPKMFIQRRSENPVVIASFSLSNPPQTTPCTPGCVIVRLSVHMSCHVFPDPLNPPPKTSKTSNTQLKLKVRQLALPSCSPSVMPEGAFKGSIQGFQQGG